MFGALIFINFNSEGKHSLNVPLDSKAIRLTLGSDQMESFEENAELKAIPASALTVYPQKDTTVFQPNAL